MIRAVFFDLDGTLVSHRQKAVPASTRRALAKLRERGIQCVAATGRHLLEFDMLPVRDIPFDGYVTLNGQLCLDAQGGLISGRPMGGADLAYILRRFAEKTVPVMLVEREALYINFVNGDVAAAQRAISTEIPAVGAYTGNEIYQAVFFVEKGREGPLAGQLPGCKVTRWNDLGVDVISREGGKAAGIQEYLARQGIGREETAAFGDGENDIEMLRFVQTGIAMGNAEDPVKASADLVTDSVDGDGIEKALLRLGLIE